MAAAATRASADRLPRRPQLHSDQLASLKSAFPWTVFLYVDTQVFKDNEESSKLLLYSREIHPVGLVN